MVYNSAKRPIAVYDANTDVTRRLWKTLKTLTGVWQHDKADAGDSDPAKAKSWDEVRGVVEQFNKIEAQEGDGKNFEKKFGLLNETFKNFGYMATHSDGSTGNIDLSDQKKGQYSKTKGAENRNKYLCDRDSKRLKQDDYLGTILPTTDCSK